MPISHDVNSFEIFVSMKWFIFIQLQQFLHPDLSSILYQYRPLRGKLPPALRVVVMQDNLGSVLSSLKSLGLPLDTYLVADRWNQLKDFEGNSSKIFWLKDVNMSEIKLAKLAPIHLLISCLPLILSESEKAKPLKRKIGQPVSFLQSSEDLIFIQESSGLLLL